MGLMMSEPVAEPLVKHTVAESLRMEIASGALRPGMRIVEGTWARKFGVAQGSIREAINILAQDGFVTKEAGRSARVVNFSEESVAKLFELRGALEGLAARLVTQSGSDLRPIEEGLNMMQGALKSGRAEDMLDGDLKFHMELCRLSNNEYLFEHARRVLVPLFAFARIRVMTSGQDPSIWARDLEAHQRIVDLIKDGQGEVAEQFVRHAMARFAKNAYETWERKEAHAALSRSKKRSGKKEGDHAGLAADIQIHF